MNVREIDFAVIDENDLRNLLFPLPNVIRDLTFVARQLIINNKCVDVFEKILNLLIHSDDNIKNFVGILSSSLVQSKNFTYYRIIMNNLRLLDFKFHNEIKEKVFQNICTSLDRNTLILLLNDLDDISFNNNKIYFLMKNNDNKNLDLILKRPEIIHNAFKNNQTEITTDIDMDKFYDKFPEFYI